MTKVKKKTIEEQYTKLTMREQMLLRPDTYIGGIKSEKRWVFTVDNIHDLNNIKIIKKEIEYNSGLIKIFDEILTNASDHAIKTGKVKSIKVDIVDNTISVWNDGDGIPVEIHKKEQIYIPEMIFGHLLTSSNYDDREQRIGGGRNGIGAKATNIFSKEFIVETADGKNYYKQTFVDNLSSDKKGKLPKPHIRSSSKKFTKITFTPDYERFGISGLTEDIKSVMIKRIIDISAYNPTVKVYFNNHLIPIKTFKDYVKLFVSEEHEIIYEKLNDFIEISVVKSDYDEFQQISLVNALATIDGGTHVNAIINDITSKLKIALSKGNKYNINPNDIKSKIFLFANCKIVNPEFSSQTKEILTTKAASFYKDIEISDNFVKKILKSDITKEIIDYIELKEQLALKKSTNGNPKKVKIRKLEDAIKAGTKHSKECSLYLTEGDSALATCQRGLSVIGKEYNGSFPLRGKPLNVRGTAIKKILENEEIKAIVSALGLEFGKKYDDLSELRYGKVVIFSDSDVDGIHIKGLLINLFDVFWPELLKQDFIYEFVSPIVKVSKGNVEKYFYKLSDYKKWRETVNVNNWFIKYYKGLGTITPAETKEFFANVDKHLIKFNYDNKKENHDLIDMVFNDKRADDRKKWLINYNPEIEVDKFKNKTYYDTFINEEMIEFSMADNIRSIPNIIDGLKPTQRKILYTLFKNDYKNEVKVSILTGSVISQSAYHQGNVSLETTIVGMAQNFVGSNNINLLLPSGEYGTRSKGGKDASAPRYIFTNLMPIAKQIFIKDDEQVLEYNYDDNLKIEPKFYVPIIPMILVNGACGIGTGYSTNIPEFNPEDLVKYITNKLNGKKRLGELHPYYKNFKGEIIKVDSKYVTKGIINKINNTTFKISELPIGVWTNNYYDVLDNLIDKKIIKDYHKNSTDLGIDINVYLTPEMMSEINMDNLNTIFQLESNINIGNFYAFDENGKMKKYADQYEIIEYFYSIRLKYYDLRKQNNIKEREHSILILENKSRFIDLILKSKIKINNVGKAEIVAQLEKLNFIKIDESYDYLLNLNIYSLTKERFEALISKLENEKLDLQKYKDTSIEDMWLSDLKKLKF